MTRTATPTKPVNVKRMPAPAQEIEPLSGDAVTSKAGTALSQVRKNQKKIVLNLDSVYITKGENIREQKSYTEDDITEMAYQIEALGGISNPIDVVPIQKSPETDNKPYLLITGFRRVLGLLQLAEVDPAWKENVPAYVVTDAQTKGATRVVQLIENLARKNLNPMEIAVAVKEALDDKACDFNQKDMARLLGRSEANISQLLKLTRLPASVQDMISSGNLPWTHARELVMNKDVPESAYADLAVKGCDMLLEDFVSMIDEKYGDDADTATTAADGTAKSGSQKAAKMLRATEVETVFVKFLTDRAKASDDKEKKFTAADLENARLDTIKTVLKDQQTTLAKDIAPYQEKIKQDEEQEKQLKTSSVNEEKFFRERVKDIEKLLDAPVDPTKPNQPRMMLSDVYGAVAKQVAAMTAEQKKAAGFDLTPYAKAETLVQKLATTFAMVKANREKAAAERKKREEEKKAQEATEAAKATGNTSSTPAGTPALAGK